MNILITGAWSSAKQNISVIESMGHGVVFMQNESGIMPCSYDWVEGVVCNGLFLHHDIENFKNLRYIQLTSAGFDRVSMEYIERNKIQIHNAKGVYGIPMAEFAIAAILMLYKQLRYFDVNQKLHRWEKHRGLLELSGKTICIVGCGNVGTECAKRLKAFDCRVVGVGTISRVNDYYETITTMDALDDLLPQCDIVILSLPLTEQTKGLFNKQRFSKMKNGCILVNISRGAIVNSDDLIESLKSNLGGAVLDVFEEEPLSESSLLWDLENVVITPHNSFAGDGNISRLTNLIVENLKGEV